MPKPKNNKLTRMRVWLKYLFGGFSLFIISAFGFVSYNNFDWMVLKDISFYQNLANPSIRIVKIKEGLRKEEVAEVVAKRLSWNEEETKEFLNAHLAYAQNDLEGRYFPKTYLIHKDEDPVVVSKTMTDEYRRKVHAIKKPNGTKIINEETALIIASLVQREAAGKHDMSLISGIIWNRVFAGMKLQVDATLQYVKGDEYIWWPKIETKYKNIDSPFNTYIYNMPPAPISNPGLDALNATYNPQKTNCLFYLHDKKRNIHCTRTYNEHKKNIDKYY